jgi:hypothetical protein
MSTAETAIQPLDETTAREAINRWSGEGYFRIRNFGDKIFLNEVTGTEAFNVRLSTHCEERTISQESVPFQGGPVDDQGKPPLPWDIRVEQPPPFEEATRTLTVPHSEHVETCSLCHGKGSVTCSQCHGRGQTTCIFCHGTGFRQLTTMVPTKDMKGNITSTPQTTQQHCSCLNGLVPCGSCGSTGMRRCSTCAGSGRVKSFDQLIVRFHTPRQTKIVDATPVPDDTFLTLKGDVLIDDQAARIDSARPVNPGVDDCVRDLLAASHRVNTDQTRILAQHLRVERIPITEIHYSYAGVEHKLWVCGKEHQVHAPNAPWHRSRFMGLLIGVALGVAAVIALVVFLLMR